MNTQATEATPAPAVYAKIAAVQADISREGISKDRQNSFDRYNFRGIDDVYNTLSPILAKHGLNILPRILERDCQERTSKKGEPMFYVTVTAEFDLIAAEDGSKHTIRTYGEAMDRADKATNKAMSAAYKYAAFMAFAIPTDGDNDADAETPDIAPKKPAAKQVEGGMPAAEWSRLVKLAEASGTTSQELMKRFKVENLRLLNQGQYSDAINLMNDRLAEKAKAETNAAQPEGFGEILEDEIPF